jgi:hypothetical protein
MRDEIEKIINEELDKVAKEEETKEQETTPAQKGE